MPTSLQIGRVPLITVEEESQSSPGSRTSVRHDTYVVEIISRPEELHWTAYTIYRHRKLSVPLSEPRATLRSLLSLVYFWRNPFPV